MSEKRVSQLLIPVAQVPWIGPHQPVEEAVRRLAEQGPEGFLLVVSRDDRRREILGSLGLGEVLRRMEPPETAGGDIPIFWQGQFQDQARQVFRLPVEEVMSPLEHALNRGSTLMEALHLMNRKDARLLIVMQGEAVVGVLPRGLLMKELVAAARPAAA